MHAALVWIRPRRERFGHKLVEFVAFRRDFHDRQRAPAGRRVNAAG